MKKLDVNSSARFIHEAIQQLGWSSDPESIVSRVKRLDLGIPAEDEIYFILSWLGKCSIIHKLEQKQYPPKSRDKYQVPDLLVTFGVKGESLPVLLEVKVSKKNKLSWKSSYLNRLKNYSSLIGLPILVAWKFYNLWLLVDLDCFKKARTNYHLSLDSAMKHNLMSFLAGDFVYVMQPNIGLHFHMKKEKLVSKNQIDESSREEKWLIRIEQAFFANANGNKVSKLPPGLWPLFISSEPVSEDRVEDEYIYQSFIIPENSGMHFAHTALPILITFFMDDEEKIHWRKHLDDHNFPVDFKVFSEAASKGIKKGFVRYIIHQQPAEVPFFYKNRKNAEPSGELARV